MQTDWSDERLMLAYRAGDADAFTILYRRHRGPLYRYLARQCGSAAEADELHQDVWLKVIHARSQYEPLARFPTWLFRIARHRLIDHYRQHARQPLAHDESAAGEDADGCQEWIERLPAPREEMPHVQLERHDTARRISLALASLPPLQREVFLLAEEGRLTLDEIATATGCGRETTKSRLRYALGKLRKSLQDLL
jgi:RNA polymerase sigma-70 factor (ECF subfamily)